MTIVNDVSDEEVALVTHSAAYQAMETLQLYLDQQNIKFDLAPLSFSILKNNVPRLKQSLLTQFFLHS